jgi:hypothetical protein
MSEMISVDKCYLSVRLAKIVLSKKKIEKGRIKNES